jgi:hypothetical protein
MPGTIFFREGSTIVTSTELIIGQRVYPLSEILAVRGMRRRGLCFWPLPRFAVAITTETGEWEVFRHRNGFVVFQLSKALERALRERRTQTAALATA